MEKFPELKEHEDFVSDLKKFVHLVPRIPSENKSFSPSHHLTISPFHSREEIIEKVRSMREGNPSADLAFYAGRFMDSCDWKPFFKAVFERNPVSIAYFRDKSPDEIYAELKSWPAESIYEGMRISLPDEVVNYKRGDGLEKAITMMNVLKSRQQDDLHLHAGGALAKVKGPGFTYEFNTGKNLEINL